MNIIITDDYAAMSRRAADFVVAAITAKPDSALVFPTGGTPLGLYEELIRRYQQGAFDPSHLRIFLLDEYVGIGPEDERALLGWLQRTLFEPLHIQPAQITPLPGNAPDLEAACRKFDQAVRDAGGLDLAILGMGPNGHLGYNEPPANATAPTRVLKLTQSSLDTCAAAWGGRDRLLPHAITAGMDLLLDARQKLLMVNGAHKRAILHAALYGPVHPDVPASYLQQAENVTVIVDKAAIEEG
ncbi:MAG: glucosamine-6-phosphate deaminase [Caldilineaceae bacterium]|nr:glucosamine-6-phosphate deaminase [Caldilineaceae bacterium]MCB0141475.1 glucosamine-6-phosphate deaminase [Caldilineaceae bacterium]